MPEERDISTSSSQHHASCAQAFCSLHSSPEACVAMQLMPYLGVKQLSAFAMAAHAMRPRPRVETCPKMSLLPGLFRCWCSWHFRLHSTRRLYRHGTPSRARHPRPDGSRPSRNYCSHNGAERKHTDEAMSLTPWFLFIPARPQRVVGGQPTQTKH